MSPAPRCLLDLLYSCSIHVQWCNTVLIINGSLRFLLLQVGLRFLVFFFDVTLCVRELGTTFFNAGLRRYGLEAVLRRNCRRFAALCWAGH